MKHLPHALPALLLSAVLPTQTFIVDASGGPGSSFTTIVAAVAAVPDGAILLVRQGTYGPFNVLAKGLTILGEPGVIVTAGLMTVSGQSSTQPFRLRGLRVLGVALSLQSCQGGAHVEDCAGNGPNDGFVLAVDQCPQVHVGRCEFSAPGGGVAASFVSSDVVCSDTMFLGFAGGIHPAMDLIAGRTDLARCQLLGGQGPGAYAIRLNGNSVRITGPGSVGAISPWTPAIGGTGTVRVNLNTTAFSGTLAGPGITVVLIDDASTSATAAVLGGTTTGAVDTVGGNLGALLFGLPAPPLVVPGFAEELWLSPANVQIAAVGQLFGFPLSVPIVVPNNLTLRGELFGWQGLTLDPTRGFVLANPAWFTVM
ncbi:MAG: hypothetical protein WAT39_05475 [Planctomycetota bacterium]